MKGCVLMKEKWIIPICSKTKGEGFKVLAKYRNKEAGKLVSVSGGRFYISDYEGDKKLAKMAAIQSRNKIQEDIDIGRYASKSLTVDECYKKSLMDLQLSVKTIRRHDSIYRHLISDEVKLKNIIKVTTSDVQNSINDFSKDRSQNNINNAMSIWRQIYKAALIAEIPVVNRAEMVMVPKSRKVVIPKDNKLNIEDFEKFLNELLIYNCRQKRGLYKATCLWYACQIMYYTGLRPQEVYALSRSDIDLDKRQLHVNKSIGSTTESTRQVIPVKTKYSNSIVPIPPGLVKVLENLLKWSKGKDLIFIDLDGLPYEIDDVSNLICHVSRLCKKKYGFSFNQYRLRHLFSKDLFDAGTNPKVIQSLMRHATENMSLYYAYTTEEDKAEAIKNRDLPK